MIKQVIKSNESVSVNDDQIVMLKEKFPGCFAKDGSFDIEKFQQCMSFRVKITNEGYGLHFLGKNYARYISQLETETVIKPDTAHNKKKENAASENIYISGDNLDALKHMLKSYQYQIKCIFIDPPYNRGQDDFIYFDNFSFTKKELMDKLSISEIQAERLIELNTKGSTSHAAWLTFMYSRLLIARNLLAKDGAIFISIDDNEQSNLKLLCDEVFGEENILGTFIWYKKLTGGYDNDNVNTQHDYILAYSRDSSYFSINLKPEESKYKLTDEKTGKKFKWDSLWNVGGLTYSKSLDYSIKAPDGTDIWPVGDRGVSFWLWSKDHVEKNRDELKFEKDKKGVWKVYKKVFASDGLIPGTISLLNKDVVGGNTNASDEIKNLFDNDKVFDYPKPTSLLKNLIERVVVQNDIILDFFSGSASTADAVIQLKLLPKYSKLKYIMVQIPEKIFYIKNGNEEPLPKKAAVAAFNLGFKTIDAIGMARIEKAAEKIRKEHPNTKVDLGFCHYTLELVSQKTLTAIEHFNPNDQSLSADNSMLKVFGKETVLETWLVRDGYGFTAVPIEIDLDGYKAYTYGRHLYLIDSDLSQKGIVELCKKYEEDDSFVPDYVAVFGYSFSMTTLSALETNLKSFKDSDKNLNITFDVRY
jgi:type III restriction enzyme/adenine-specific DNA-methyltransferase